jgi:hypothetical protein
MFSQKNLILLFLNNFIRRPDTCPRKYLLVYYPCRSFCYYILDFFSFTGLFFDPDRTFGTRDELLEREVAGFGKFYYFLYCLVYTYWTGFFIFRVII